MKILNTKLNRDIKHNFLQFIAVILIAFLSITLFCGLTSNYKLLEERVDMLYEKTNFGDYYLTLSSYDSSDNDYISNLNSYSDFNKRLYINAKYKKSDLNLIFTDNPTISKPVIEKGKEGFLINSNFLEENEIEIGSEIVISVNNMFKDKFNFTVKEGKVDFLKNETIDLTFKITGTMIHAESVENSNFSAGLGVSSYESIKTMITDMFLDNYRLTDLIGLRNTEFFNQFIFKSDDINTLKNDLNSYYNNKENNNLLASMASSNLPSNATIQNDIIQAKKLTYVFPIIFFIVGILVILTTLSQMIYREKILIGSLKALGFKKKEISKHYISYGIVLCLIGGVLGFIVGPILIPKVMGIKYDLLYELPKANANFFYLENILCFILIISCGGFASYITVRKELMLKPALSMRERAPSTFGLKNFRFIEKFPLTLKMALRNIIRKPIRSFMLILGLMGCTALLLCGFGIDDTLNYGIDKEINDIFPFDLNLSYSKDISGEINIEDYEYFETYSLFPTQIITDHSFNSTIYFIDKDSKTAMFEVPNEGALATTKLKDEFNLKVGDKVTLICLGQKEETYISGFIETSVTQGLILNKEYNFLDNNENRAFIKLKDSSEDNLVSEKKKLEELKLFDSVVTITEYEERADSLLSSISLMTLTIKIFAIALAVVVIYNLALLNLNERIKEIATIKVLGFSKKEIVVRFMTEIIILCIIGVGLGLLLGYPLVILVLSINETPLIAFLYHINGFSYLLAILVSLGTSLVVNLFMSKKALKVKMVESLKSIE